MASPEFRIVMRIRVIQLPLLTLLLLLATIIVTCGGDDRNDNMPADSPPVIGGEDCPAVQYSAPASTDKANGALCDENECHKTTTVGYDGTAAVVPYCDKYVVIGDKTWTVCTPVRISYPCAVCYAEHTTFCGYDDWRLPTVQELTTLYDPSNSRRIDWCNEPDDFFQVKIRSPFCLSAYNVWGLGYEPGQYFEFLNGQVDSRPPSNPFGITALLVRP